ncbi:hypothetical protein, partial [Aliikangiella maris]
MNRELKLKTLPVIISATLSMMSLSATANESFSIAVQQQTTNGAPTFVTGNLGSMTEKSAAQSLTNILSQHAAFGYTGQEKFSVKRQWVDELGKSHTHFNQTINGLNVYGTSLIMHANLTNSSLTSTSGQVYALTGS